MVSKLTVLVKKELRELLRDPRIIIPQIIIPPLLFLFMGGIMGLVFKAGVKEITTPLPATALNVTVVNFDQGPYGSRLIKYLEGCGVRIAGIYNSLSAVGPGTNLVLIIPAEFSKLMESLKEPPTIRILVKITKLRIAWMPPEVKKAQALGRLVESFMKQELLTRMHERGLNIPSAMLAQPLTMQIGSIIDGHICEARPEQLQSYVVNILMIYGMCVFALLTTSFSLAATAVASEKELKTLETLLAAPVSRVYILLAKVIGAEIVALLGALSFLGGFYIYWKMVYEGAFGAEFGLLTEIPELSARLTSPAFIVGTFLALLMTLFCVCGLGLTLALPAEDVRSAQQLAGSIVMLFLIPALLVWTGTYDMLPRGAKLAVEALPFTHTFLVPLKILNEEYAAAALGITYIGLFTLAVLLIAARIFTTEKVLTMRFRLGRRRRLSRES